MSQGKFIVFEGIDGSGTTTQCKLLASYFREVGISFIHTREPGGTPAAEKMRNLVLDPALGDIAFRAELFLYAASRSQHVEELIRPALGRGDMVICDRYIASSLAYQGHGRGLDLDVIRQVNELAVVGCMPDLTVYLDLPQEVARQRRDQRGGAQDRLEQAGERLQEKVAQGYRQIAKEDPSAMVFDACLEKDQLAKNIREALRIRWPWFPVEENES